MIPGLRLSGERYLTAFFAAQSRWPIASEISSVASLSGFPVSRATSSANSERRFVITASHATSTFLRPEKPSACQAWLLAWALATALSTSSADVFRCLAITSPVAGLWLAKS